MALSATRKSELARMTLPGEAAMRTRIQEFIIRSGLTMQELADQLGVSRTSVGQFMAGAYDRHHPLESNTLNLRAKFKEYMDLMDVRQDIRMRGEHYATADYKAILSSSLKALRDGAAYVIDGPPGTQKTWSLLNVKRHVEEKKLGRAVYVYSRVNHSPQSFLIECCTAAGIPNRGSIDQLLRKLQFFLSRERCLLLVDEGQHLDLRALEVLRQLLDLPPYFGVVLAGSHELAQQLQHWQMEQWRRRVQKTHYLAGPSHAEARDILAKQLGMTAAAEADGVIADCMATALRSTVRRGKETTESYEYISAGLLFDTIRGVKNAAVPLEAIA